MNQTPQDKRAEMALVGTLMVHAEAYDSCAPLISSKDFYDPTARAIWQAAERLHKKGIAIDPLTISTELPREVSRTAISQAIADAPLGSEPTRYAQVVSDLAVARRIIEAAQEIAKIGYSKPESIDQAVDQAQKIMFGVNARRSANSSVGTGKVATQITQRINHILTYGDNLGVPTGIALLDVIIGGWQNSDLVIVAARPSVGKTALALSSAKTAAGQHGKRVLIYSLEMSAQSIGTRLLAAYSGIGVQEILRGRIQGADWIRLAAGLRKLMLADIIIDDTPTITPIELRSRARQLSQQKKVDLIIVDYLQLMSSDRATKDANRVIEVAEISRSLKSLARELDVPVVALSQLNRSSEHREDGEPRLSDLRDSGAIEQDADIVLMLWRPSDHAVRLKVAKHRNGPTGEVDLDWKKETVEFK
jgi:replicative DNA helicase